MAARNSKQIAAEAERIYEQRLRAGLEKSHPGLYVAIEPNSGEHFLGETLSEAGAAARKAHPQSPSFILRIGHKTAVHVGKMR